MTQAIFFQRIKIYQPLAFLHRNLSVDGGETVCQEMVKKDVLTPLVAFLKQVKPYFNKFIVHVSWGFFLSSIQS